MKFRDLDSIDPGLKSHLSHAEHQIDVLFRIEESYLTLKAAKDTKWAVLYMQSPQGTVEQKKAWVHVNRDWSEFQRALAESEAQFHRERHKYEVRCKYIDAAYLSLKIDKKT